MARVSLSASWTGTGKPPGVGGVLVYGVLPANADPGSAAEAKSAEDMENLDVTGDRCLEDGGWIVEGLDVKEDDCGGPIVPPVWDCRDWGR